MYRLQNPFLFTGKLVVSMRLEDNHGRTIFEKEQDVAPFAGEPNAAFASSMGIALEESIDHILGKFRPTNSNPPRHVAGDNATHAPSNPLHKIEPTTTTTTTLGKRRHSCDIPLPSIENPDEFQQPKRARTGEVDRAEPLSSGDEGYDHVDHDDHEDHEERRSLGSSSTQNSGHSPSPDFTPDMEAQPSAHFDNADDANNEDHGDHRLRGGTNYSDPDWRPSPDVWATLDMEIQPDADGDNNEEPGGYRHWRSTSTPDPGLTPAPDIGSMFPEPEPQAPEMKAEPSVVTRSQAYLAQIRWETRQVTVQPL